MKTLSISAAALLLSVSATLAAPCNTEAKGKTPEGSASNEKSSSADNSSKNTAGGNQPASPGTVGALNNLGPNQGVTGQGATSDKGQGKEDPGAKNTAGGNQPASPGTVGAMNNAEKTQNAGKGDDC